MFGNKAKGKRPESVFDIGVAVASIDEHGSCLIGQIANVTLRDAVLVVGIDPTKGYGLS